MRTERRRGFIGFLLTMALGIALGTATLVASKEIITGSDKNKTQPTNQSSYADRAQALKVAWKSYDQARLAYESALAKKADNVSAKHETMLKAKGIMEKAILRATPGVPSILERPSGNSQIPATAPNSGSSPPIPQGNPYDGDQPVSELRGR